MDFGSHVDGVVAAAAALVNVATSGERQGRPYAVPTGEEFDSAVHGALRSGDRRVSLPARATADGFVTLACGLRRVFASVDGGEPDAAAEQVNALLQQYRPTPYLEKHGGEPWHLHFHGPESADPTGWGGAMATGLATVLGSDYADRLGICAAPGCDRVFVDVSRNGNRRFCSEACQNRVKAAAHRARRRT